jgi:hypothetical protein
VSEAFGNIARVPLRYTTPKGTFKEQIALHCSSFVRGGVQLGLQIALSSTDSLILPAGFDDRAKLVGQRYAVKIRLLADDLARLPTPVNTATEVVRQIDHEQADISRARDCFNNCRASHGRIVSGLFLSSV